MGFDKKKIPPWAGSYLLIMFQSNYAISTSAPASFSLAAKDEEAGKKSLKDLPEKIPRRFCFKAVKKDLEGFDEPDYFLSNDYVRTGTARALCPDEEYYKKCPQGKAKSFVNHNLGPYLYLTAKSESDLTNKGVAITMIQSLTCFK